MLFQERLFSHLATKVGNRNLGAKTLFKLEEAERETAQRKSAAERLVEGLVDDRTVVSGILGRDSGKNAAKEIAVEYNTRSATKTLLPRRIALERPTEEGCRKLRALFAETLDTRMIVLACLPDQIRRERFIDQLTAESKARLTTVALSLVIPDWRTLVVQPI